MVTQAFKEGDTHILSDGNRMIPYGYFFPPFPDPQPGATWDIQPFAGIELIVGTSIDNDIDLSNATSVSFHASSDTPMTISLKILTSNINDFAFCGRNININTEKSEYTIPLTTLTQPS